MVFPPIFAYVIFFILDLLSLVFSMSVFLAPLGIVITNITTILYIGRVYFKYGPEKTVEKLFKYKNIPSKVLTKKVMKVFGSTVIPFITVWAIYDDYKEEVNKLEGKEEGPTKLDKLKKAAIIGAAAVATGGAAAPAAARVAAGATAAGTTATASAAAGGVAARAAAGGIAGGTTTGALTGVGARSAVGTSGAAAGRVATRSSMPAGKTVGSEAKAIQKVASHLGNDKYREKEESEENKEIGEMRAVDNYRENSEDSKRSETQESSPENLVTEIEPGALAQDSISSVGSLSSSVGKEVRQINPWMSGVVSKDDRESTKDRTIFERLGGTTRLDFEDYFKYLEDYSQMRTYEKLREERALAEREEEQKKIKEKKAREEEKALELLRQRNLEDIAYRKRFGDEAFKRMSENRLIRKKEKARFKEKENKSIDDDIYRE